MELSILNAIVKTTGLMADFYTALWLDTKIYLAFLKNDLKSRKQSS